MARVKFDYDRLRALHAQGLSGAEVARQMGIARNALFYHVRLIGLKFVRPKRAVRVPKVGTPAKVTDAQLLRAHANGKKRIEIAEDYGMCVSSVRRRTERLGLVFPKGQKRPDCTPAALAKGAGKPPAPPPEIKPPVDADALVLAVVQGGKTYAGRREIAAAHGVTDAKVLQVWHRVRGRG